MRHVTQHYLTKDNANTFQGSLPRPPPSSRPARLDQPSPGALEPPLREFIITASLNPITDHNSMWDTFHGREAVRGDGEEIRDD